MIRDQPTAVSKKAASLPVEIIERRIYLIRGKKVMLDADLAELYQVLTKNLNLAVRRNIERFPPDFMFQLRPEEAASLRLQSATSNPVRRDRRAQAPACTTQESSDGLHR